MQGTIVHRLREDRVLICSRCDTENPESVVACASCDRRLTTQDYFAERPSAETRRERLSIGADPPSGGGSSPSDPATAARHDGSDQRRAQPFGRELIRCVRCHSTSPTGSLACTACSVSFEEGSRYTFRIARAAVGLSTFELDHDRITVDNGQERLEFDGRRRSLNFERRDGTTPESISFDRIESFEVEETKGGVAKAVTANGGPNVATEPDSDLYVDEMVFRFFATFVLFV